MEYVYAIETMAKLLAIHNGGGFKTKVMRFNVMVRSMKQYYANVGFDSYGGGRQGGALNAPWVL